jgi:hypothetical protein
VLGFDRVIGFPGFQDTAEPGVFGGDCGGHLDHCLITYGRVFLRQITDADAAFECDYAFIGGFLAEDD